MLVRSFAANHVDKIRTPYHSEMGGHACRNYNPGKANTVHLGYMELANEIIHSSQMMVVHDEPKIGDGLLIASDWNLKKRLLHLTIEEFQSFVRRVLDDEIRLKAIVIELQDVTLTRYGTCEQEVRCLLEITASAATPMTHSAERSRHWPLAARRKG